MINDSDPWLATGPEAAAIRGQTVIESYMEVSRILDKKAAMQHLLVDLTQWAEAEHVGNIAVMVRLAQEQVHKAALA
jgi:outer membrane protein assembly factor BamD (BamD/ComL family)